MILWKVQDFTPLGQLMNYLMRHFDGALVETLR